MRFISTLATMAALAAIPSISQAQSAPGGDHNDPPPDEYYRALEKFIGSLPK